MAATKKPRTATVRLFRPGWWGITDGKLWWFYAFPTEKEATARLPGFADPEVLRVNVSLPEPGTLVQERKG